ncbi:MAG: transporter substrate-binding domain-containing protein [Desulfobacteraceae bacterium]|jgi:polar amino acid transport system substrate-binding protein
MMKNLWVLFTILAMASPVFADEVMKFAYAHTSPPISWEEDGKMRGILIDIAEELVQNRLGIMVSHKGYPWKRSQHLVRMGKADALITNGPMRKKWAEHSREVVVNLQHMLYVKAGGPKLDQLKKVRTIDDLKLFTLVDERGSAWAEKNLIERGIEVHLVADHDTMYRLVAKGRVDAVVYEPLMARYHIKILGMQAQLIELPLDTVPVPFHIVIGKSSPHVKMLPKIDKAIRQMKQDGTLERILDNYR